jgi:hypothetical protein
MKPGSEQHEASWRELMTEGGTVAELWSQIRKIAPHELIGFTIHALDRSVEMLSGPTGTLVERRRALLVSQLASHRLVFDLMGLPPSPVGNLSAEVPPIFF